MHTTPPLLGLVGDVHGQAAHAVAAVDALHARGVTEVHFLGDFGMVWSGRNSDDMALKRLRLALEANGQTAFVTGGNHENYDRLLAIEPDGAGIRWIRKNIGLLPRGWRALTPSGRVIASLGGANSIDRYSRKAGVSWWPQEQITEEDLAALGTDLVDVLLAHDSPMSGALDERLRAGNHLWPAAGLAYSHEGHVMFHRGFRQVKPRLVVSGHYHLFLDVVESFRDEDGAEFESRVVILHESRFPRFVGLLDTESLELKVMRDVYSNSWTRTG